MFESKIAKVLFSEFVNKQQIKNSDDVSVVASFSRRIAGPSNKEWTREEWNAYKKKHPATQIKPKFRKPQTQHHQSESGRQYSQHDGTKSINPDSFKRIMDKVGEDEIRSLIDSNYFGNQTDSARALFDTHRKPDYINPMGTQFFLKNGELHRDGDQPAVIRPNGTQFFYKNGKSHREGDKPAMIHADGREEYYKNGKRHRDGDKPAMIHPNGSEEYYKNGERHRDGDKPAMIHPNGSEEYWKNNKLHRDGDKPARIHADGRVEYWKNDERQPKPQVQPSNPHQKRKVNQISTSKVKLIMNSHNLTNDDDEMQELAHFKSTLGQRVPAKDVGKWYARNVNQLKSDFIKNMSPQNYSSAEAFQNAKKRMQDMPPSDFAKILAAIVAEDEKE